MQPNASIHTTIYDDNIYLVNLIMLLPLLLHYYYHQQFHLYVLLQPQQRVISVKSSF